MAKWRQIEQESSHFHERRGYSLKVREKPKPVETIKFLQVKMTEVCHYKVPLS